MTIERGSLVAYLPTNSDGTPYKCEIGVVKRLTGDGDAFIAYGLGDTCARTPGRYLVPVDNWFSVKGLVKRIEQLRGIGLSDLCEGCEDWSEAPGGYD